MDAEPTSRLDRYAELVVRVGVNLQPGQTVHVSCVVEHAELARAVTEQAYRAGASRVVVGYEDDHVRRATIAHAPDEVLSTTSPGSISSSPTSRPTGRLHPPHRQPGTRPLRRS